MINSGFQQEEYVAPEEPEVNSASVATHRRSFSAKGFLIIIPVLALLYFGFRLIEKKVWEGRLAAEASVTEIKGERYQACFRIIVTTPSENTVQFSSQAVSRSAGYFHVMANDLPMGENWLYFTVSRGKWSSRDSVLVTNPYSPITASIGYERDVSNRVTNFTLVTEPGVRLQMGSLDTLLAEGIYARSLSPDSIMQAHNPDVTPTILLNYPAHLENASGNTVRDTVRVAYTFPRVSLTISEPSNRYISRTGSGYTIRGTATSRATVKFFAGSSVYARSLGQVRAQQNGSFSKWVSVTEFGDNVFTIVASVDRMTSDTTRVTINRQMTDSERRTAYQNQCERVTAEYLADNHSLLVGRKVRVWGRTVEWLGQSQLHCYAGSGHFIANLIGFDRVPALQGLSFTVWGEVTSRSQSFTTQGGDYVRAPVIDAVYTTTGY